MLQPVSRRHWVWGSLTAASIHATFRPLTSAPVANQASSPALGSTPGGSPTAGAEPPRSTYFASSLAERLCQALSQHPLAGRVLSIHAVRAAGATLDILESSGLLKNDPNSPTIIFHWFSGTSDELVRARHAGSFFSINERMLATKRGREYARQIPLNRLLLETDAPAEQNKETTARQLVDSLARTSEVVAAIKKCDSRSIESAVLGNTHSIFDLR